MSRVNRSAGPRSFWNFRQQKGDKWIPREMRRRVFSPPCRHSYGSTRDENGRQRQQQQQQQDGRIEEEEEESEEEKKPWLHL